MMYDKDQLEEFLWDFVNSYDTVNDEEKVLQSGIDLLIKRIEIVMAPRYQ